MFLVELEEDAVVGQAGDAGVLKRLLDRVLEGGRDKRVDEGSRTAEIGALDQLAELGAGLQFGL